MFHRQLERGEQHPGAAAGEDELAGHDRGLGVRSRAQTLPAARLGCGDALGGQDDEQVRRYRVR